MNFQKPTASLHIPDGKDEVSAWKRITHLGIGAHADDLEFMARHGILACFDREDQWFGGVTCTDGGGSVSSGENKSSTLTDRRRQEQQEAADIGQYGIMVQLGYTSQEAKDKKDGRLTSDLSSVFSACRPQIVYTHNPADKHETHIAVLSSVVSTIRKLPPDQRPRQLLGCEVWRDLDWLNDEDKVILDVGGHPALSEKITHVFSSQIAGGKRYDLAVRGRELAHATFLNSHREDGPSAIWLAMDLTPLLVDDNMTISQLVNGHIARFKNDVMEKLSRWEKR